MQKLRVGDKKQKKLNLVEKKILKKDMVKI